MPAFGGKDILIRPYINGTATTLTGLRTKSLKINNELVDITNSDSPNRWRELLAGVGMRSLSISGQGVLMANFIDLAAMQAVLTGGQLTCDVVVPNMGTFTGSFYFQAASITGEHNKETVYDLTLESNGSVNLQ